MGSLITKARKLVPAIYGITGLGYSADEMRNKVAWLETEGNFKFGGISWNGSAEVSWITYYSPQLLG